MRKLIFHGFIYIAIAFLGLTLLLYFSQPQRLAHDQITYRWYILADENPQTFTGDYLLGTGKYKVEFNYFSMQILAWLKDKVGAEELVTWFLLPLVFIVFTAGMYHVLYYFTKNFLISLAVAVISNIHVVPVFVSEWGLPGPSSLDPWTFVFAFYPFLFLSFYRGIVERRESLLILSFLGAGILGNIHTLSAFYLIGTFLLTYLLIKKISLYTLTRCFLYGTVSIVVSLPFLLKFYLNKIDHITSFDPHNNIYRKIIETVVPHVTLSGRLDMFRIWLVDQWYITWPGFVLLLLVILYSRRPGRPQDLHFFARFGAMFVVSTLIWNGAFSLVQLTRLYVFNQLPMYNEPRGIQLMYILFFISLAIVLNILFQQVQPFIARRKFMVLAIGVILSLSLAYMLSPRIAAVSKQKTTQRYLFLTCDAEMYRRLANVLKPGDVILADPTYYGAIRICMKAPVVVQSRDAVPAYDQGSDIALEWYTRFTGVSKAFEKGGDELLDTAKKYNARVIVSRQCVPVPNEKLEYFEMVKHPSLGHEGCIYIPR